MKLTKEDLQNIYENNTSKKACDILGVSPATLRKYLVERGIPLKGKGNRVNHDKIRKLIIT